MFYVYLVDEGFFEEVPFDHLFEIPPELMSTPLLSMRVSLAEADAFNRYGLTANEAFTNLALNGTFTAKIPSDYSSIPPQKLQLFDSEGRNVKDLLLTLLNKGPSTILPTPGSFAIAAAVVSLTEPILPFLKVNSI